jgi:hypothetical protein
MEEMPGETLVATTDLMASFAGGRSRRCVLTRAIAGATGLAASVAAGLATEIMQAQQVYAETVSSSASLTEFFNILATGEALFVTFYSHGVANHGQLGINGAALDALQAILVEEQLHFNFAKAHGGVPATTHFSFPHGAATFQKRALFLATQQLSEELTNGALLAWIKDMAAMGLPRLAQVGGQLMQVEGGHRVVGRVILKANPWDNWAFGPVVLNNFLQVPSVVKAVGFLSPRPGNDFVFHPVSTHFPGVINTTPGNV